MFPFARPARLESAKTPTLEDIPVWVGIATTVAGVGTAAGKRYRGWRKRRGDEEKALALIPKIAADLEATRQKVDRLANSIDGRAESLAWLEARAKSAMQTSAIPVWETDAHGNCTSVNDAYERLTQRQQDDLVGNGWEDIVAKEDYERLMTRWRASVRDRATFAGEFRLVRPDGTSVMVRAQGVPVTDENGTMLGFTGQTYPIGGHDG